MALPYFLLSTACYDTTVILNIAGKVDARREASAIFIRNNTRSLICGAHFKIDRVEGKLARLIESRHWRPQQQLLCVSSPSLASVLPHDKCLLDD